MRRFFCLFLFLVCSRYVFAGSPYIHLMKKPSSPEKMYLLDDAYEKELHSCVNKFLSHAYVGNIQYVKNNFDAAIKNYRLALDNKRQDWCTSNDLAAVLFNIGHTYSVMNNAHESIHFFEQALKLNPSDEYALFELGCELKKQKKFGKALDNLKKALTINHNYLDAYVEIGIILRLQGNSSGAIAYLQKALEAQGLDTNFQLQRFRAIFELAKTFRDFGQTQEAISTYEMALEINRHSYEALYQLGCLHSWQKNFKKSIEYFQQALQLNPHSKDSQFGLSKAYLSAKQTFINDIVINNMSSSCGYCLSGQRYEMLDDVIKSYNRPVTVLDLGAAQGYFSFRLAQKYSDSVFAMVEQNEELLDLCKLNSELENIIFLNKKLSVQDVSGVADCEHFDVVFCLLFVNSFEELWKPALEQVLRLGDKLIIEVPSAGVSRIKKTKGCDYEEVNEYLSAIGSVIGHVFHPMLDGEFTTIYLVETKKEGILRAYWTRPNKVPGAYRIKSDENEKKLLKLGYNSYPEREVTQWFPGINLLTFKMLNGIWPTREIIEHNLIDLGYLGGNDVGLKNLIVQGSRLASIDILDHNYSDKIYTGFETIGKKRGRILSDLDASEREIFKRAL